MFYCLHGFLGNSKDWDGFSFASHQAPSLFGHQIGHYPLKKWANVFVRGFREDKPILVAYSLGGRLALHGLLADPKKFRAAIIISTHLGLSGEAERQARIKQDELWAERFLHDDWDLVLEDWNKRPVFGEKKHLLDRNESEYSRKSLAVALRSWSLGHQENLQAQLHAIDIPVLCVAGARDERYVEQAELACQALPNASLAVIPDAYHRAPWEKPKVFQENLKEFYYERVANNQRV